MDLPDATITYNGLDPSNNATESSENSTTIIYENLNPSIDVIDPDEDSGSENPNLKDTNPIPSLSIQESILNDSRITPSGNGSQSDMSLCTQPTSGQKWWAAVILGFIFVLVSSPVAYHITSTVTTSLGGLPLMEGPGPNVAGLLVHTIIFILIVRLILW
jgi:hypothetical protein